MPNAAPVHRYAWQDKPGTRLKRASKVYNTQRWRRVRAMKLKRNTICERCEAQGLTALAIDVHHVVPLSEGGEPYTLGNLEALCKPCHGKETRREAK